ncbi:MAG: ABC transporter ATP-binding protein [Clostridium sp.]|nr:ABC transporter ATP-binding protein [Clostridium sp.]
MEEKKIAIKVDKLEKAYKLYDKPSDRLKEALGLSRGKRYKEHYALKGVDAVIYQGETVGIIGTNGSGKSTILKIITGVLNPTRGEVQVNGRISALLELGAGFNMEYNGIENVYLNGTMIGFSEKEIDERLEDILNFADIGDYVYQPVKTYSSGMFVRLAFAVAINIDPEILIVDEALSVGDVFFQAKCYHKFEEFKKMGKTIVFVSHDLSSISKYCDRVILLNQGVKLGEGSPREMIDAYKQVLVGQYPVAEDKEENLLEDDDIRAAAAGKSGGIGVTNGADGIYSNGGTNISGPGSAGREAGRGRAKDAGKPGVRGEVKDAGKPSVGGASTASVGSGVLKNPELLEYGTRAAVIEEYYICDGTGRSSSAVLKGQECSVHMVVRFMEDIQEPIFAFTIKNIKGVEITGTNTMVEKAFLESVKAGSVKHIIFTQKIDLQGGEYLISLGVTGYENEDFQVYHRLYDAMDLTVISDKDTIGYYDTNSQIIVADETAGET